MSPSAHFDLERFVEAQADNYAFALAELRAGKKQTHWSWYVLPQIKGLGSSAMSFRYAISGAREAKAYLDHPVLGSRLQETVAAIGVHENSSAVEILGAVDAQKFHSCVTLFAAVSAKGSPFHQALARHFSNSPDQTTLKILANQAPDEAQPV